MTFYRIAKRTLDILIALPATILLLPVLIVIVVIIRLTSKGPAIFAQERAGKNAKPFTLYKFRTMKTDIDPFGPSPKSEEDPRLTKIGKLLREHSLDELPQLVNVLRGDMSLVGPRPEVPKYVEEFKDDFVIILSGQFCEHLVEHALILNSLFFVHTFDDGFHFVKRILQSGINHRANSSFNRVAFHEHEIHKRIV